MSWRTTAWPGATARLIIVPRPRQNAGVLLHLVEEMEEVHYASLAIKLASYCHDGITTIDSHDPLPHVATARTELLIGLKYPLYRTKQLAAPKEICRLKLNALDSFHPIAGMVVRG